MFSIVVRECFMPK